GVMEHADAVANAVANAVAADAGIEASNEAGVDPDPGVDGVLHWPGGAGQPGRRPDSALPGLVEQLEARLDEVAGVPAWSMDETELPDTLGRVAVLQARLDELSS